MAERNAAQSDNHSKSSKYRKIRGALVAALLGSTMLAVPMLVPSTMISPPLALAQTQDGARLANNAPFSFADLVERVSPAVVSIRVQSRGSSNNESRGNNQRRNENRRDDDNREDNSREHDRRDNDRDENRRGNGKRGMQPDRQSERGNQGGAPFNELFRRFFDENDSDRAQSRERRGQGQRRFSTSQGSGFVISEDGYVVTNNHVIENAVNIEISFDDGSTHDATLIGTDSRTDLALLKIDSDRTFEYVQFANEDVRIGDWVVAVGNPFGLGGTVTAGIVSALGRDIGSGPYDNYLQIDASINRGNSGGPAFNLNGRVIGVNTAIYSPSGGSVGIGFAIPASVVQEVINDLRQNGIVTRGWLGVGIQNVTEDIAESLGLDGAGGAIVTSVSEGSPAQDAGVEEGDTILTVNGENVENSRDLARRIGSLEPDDDVVLGILREGEELDVTVILGALPSSPEDNANNNHRDDNDQEQDNTGDELERLGMLMEVDPEEDNVVITEVDPDSSAYEKGLREGDIIVEVAGVQVSDLSDVLEGLGNAAERSRKSVLIRVRSGDQQRFVALPLG